MLQINEATRLYIREHTGEDVRRLALQPRRHDVDMPFALDQIAGREVARHKLPAWAAIEGIVYPPHLALEQCSGEAAARYKASLLSGGTLVDLTGGLGVDFSFMSRGFQRAIYVERQEALCEIVDHNFRLMEFDNIEVVNGDGVQYLNDMFPVDVIYLDPARRDAAGRRTYSIADCTPDVQALADTLLAKAPTVLVKLSPMLDVSHVLATLPCVTDVHIVSTGGECKELLVLMRRGALSPKTVHCVNDGIDFAYELGGTIPAVELWDGESRGVMYLYEPNPSMMKAGCFNQVAEYYGMQVVSHDSHLLVSDKYADNFSGRCFIIDAVTTMNKGELKHILVGISHANVAVRNFPMRAADLAKRLGLKDGGDTYIFGTTTASGKRILLICRKTESC
ncbi:MAG: RsmD family RNA methyltransferase [Muribaculaceae bacterium]|nr:RsmD family RNA methyltransferase [Muribaculaceae bacterium]